MSSVEGLLLSVAKSVHLNQDSSVSMQRDSFFWDSLFRNFNYSFDAVYTVIDSILTTKDRCQMTPLYIQAIVLGDTRFLVSNTSQHFDFSVTPVDSRWLLGSSADCEISIPAQSIAPRHAMIDCCDSENFYLTDVGGQLNTRLNRSSIPASQPQILRNGDMLELGSLFIEFFIDHFDQSLIGYSEDDELS